MKSAEMSEGLEVGMGVDYLYLLSLGKCKVMCANVLTGLSGDGLTMLLSFDCSIHWFTHT